MPTLREQTINLVQSLPDEKMPYVFELLKWALGILNDKNNTSNKPPVIVWNDPSEAVKAWKRFQSYKGIILRDVDTKAELAEAKDEKYTCSV